MVDSFIHFNTQTSASFGKSLLRPDKLVSHCHKLGQPAIALCDHNNAFLAMRFAKHARNMGVQPIHGARVTVDCSEWADTLNIPESVSEDRLYLTLGLIAHSSDGWTALSRLLTQGWVQGRKHKRFSLTWNELCACNDGLILLDGGSDGLAGHQHLHENDQALNRASEIIASVFKDRYYVEVMRQTKRDHAIEESRIDTAKQLGLPILASHRVRFLDEKEQQAHEILQCIIQQYKIQDEARPRSYPDQLLCSGTEMRQRFHDYPEASDNTIDLARRVHFALNSAKKIRFPRFPKLGQHSESELLQKIAQEGLQKKLDQDVYPSCLNEAEQNAKRDLYQKRLDKELGIINTVGYVGYFLIVADFVDFARSQSIPVGLGRGSATGSIVSWVLGITQLDPIAHDLLFERFINPDRLSPPDIDIDLCQDRRSEVITYVQKQYGDRHVAHIITFGRMQARAVTRDVGRVLGLPYSVVDRIVRLIPENLPLSNLGLKDILKPSAPQAIELYKQYKSNSETKRLLNFAMQLEGLYRNASLHAAGVVISDQPLDEQIPLYSDPESSMLVTQFDMDDIAEVGMLKFDFLGLTTLSIIRSTQVYLQKRSAHCPLSSIPLDDTATFKMLQNDRVTGVFQLESHGMRRVIKDLQPDTLSDIIALVALFRPGPMRNIPSYINRKHGKEDINYPHPLLESVLQETYGIAVYQEQVMRIAQLLAGFSLQEADLLRQAMGKKIVEKINALRQPFLDGAQRNKVDPKTASTIFDALKEFANYGFNKSHAAAYGLTSYYTAYFKCHYPAEYLASCLNYAFNDGPRISLLVREAQASGLAVLPPDINRSEEKFSVIDDSKTILYGLGAIKNVGRSTAEEIVKERKANGTFSNLEDFFRRVHHQALNARGLESLIDATCFAALYPDAQSIVATLPKLLTFQQHCQVARHASQQSLFGEKDIFPFPSLKPTEGSKYAKYDPAERDHRAFGFYFTKHPLDPYQDLIESKNVIPSKDLESHLDKATESFLMAAVPTGVRSIPTKSGQVMRILACSDRHGPFEVAIFPDQWSEKLEMQLEAHLPGLLTLAIRSPWVSRSAKKQSPQAGTKRVNLTKFQALNNDAAINYSTITIYARYDDFDPTALHSLLAQAGNGKQHHIKLIVTKKDGQRRQRLRFEDENNRYSLNPRFRDALTSLPGITQVIYD